jgi:soluble lytic murein transglycosylase-like protein
MVDRTCRHVLRGAGIERGPHRLPLRRALTRGLSEQYLRPPRPDRLSRSGKGGAKDPHAAEAPAHSAVAQTEKARGEEESAARAQTHDYIQPRRKPGSEPESQPRSGSGGSGRLAEQRDLQQAGIDGNYLLSIARCESSLNPRAVGSSGYYGLFQFDQQTWAAYGYGSIYDPVAQSQTAARLIAAGQTSRWPNCA